MKGQSRKTCDVASSWTYGVMSKRTFNRRCLLPLRIQVNARYANFRFTISWIWKRSSREPHWRCFIIRDSGIETTRTTRIEQVKCNQSVDMGIDMDNTLGLLDEKSLLSSMYDRFKSKKDTCTKNARYHQGLNYVISCLLIIFQIVLIAINQAHTFFQFAPF